MCFIKNKFCMELNKVAVRSCTERRKKATPSGVTNDNTRDLVAWVTKLKGGVIYIVWSGGCHVTIFSYYVV